MKTAALIIGGIFMVLGAIALLLLLAITVFDWLFNKLADRKKIKEYVDWKSNIREKNKELEDLMQKVDTWTKERDYLEQYLQDLRTLENKKIRDYVGVKGLEGTSSKAKDE